MALQDYCKLNLKNFSNANKSSIIKTYSEVFYKKNIKFYNFENNGFFSSFDTNVLKNIDEQYLEDLDEFIENLLIDYSVLYSSIVVSTKENNIILSHYFLSNKNLYRDVDRKNKANKKDFIKYMTVGDIDSATKKILEKKYERTIPYKKTENMDKERCKVENFYNDDMLSEIHLELQDMMSKTPTYADLKKDINAYLSETYLNVFPKDSIRNLSKYLADEIFLRVQDKESYVEGSENYTTSEELQNIDDEIDQYIYERILPKLAKLYESKSQDAYEEFWEGYV